MNLKGKMAWFWVVASALVLAPLVGKADTVYLKDGTVKEGTIIEEDEDEITLEMTISGIKASIHIRQDEIDHIDRTRSPKEALAARASKIESNDAEGWFKLGKEYKRLGYPDEAQRCFQKAIKADPKHEGAGKELELIGAATGEFANADTIIRSAQELLDAKKYKEALEKAAPLLDMPLTQVNSVQRKDVLNILIKCYECLGNWPKAEECYTLLLKCPTVDKSEVAQVRVKQRILKENPDGMIDAGAIEAKSRHAQANLPKIEDIVKAPLDIATAPLKVGAELVAGGKGHKSTDKGGQKKGEKKETPPKFVQGKKLPLSNPEVMDLVIRAEAEGILLEAQRKMERADAQAQSDKIWEWTPFPYLGGIASAVARPKTTTIKQSPADKLYEEAADTASDADYLVPGISAALRLKIAQKRAALLDEFIEKTRKEMEAHPYHMPPPPPNTPPAQAAALIQQQNTRLNQMNVSPDKAAEYKELVQRLDALQSRKLELLQPFSDQILPFVEKAQKDREQLSEIRAKAEKIAELADAIKENEKFEALIAEYTVKAKANQPNNFDYGYEKYLDASGVYLFKDRGRRWRQQTDLCVSYCEKAMDAGRKRIALLKKFPDRPQFQRDIETTKAMIVQMYQLEQNVLMDRNRTGRAARYY